MIKFLICITFFTFIHNWSFLDIAANNYFNLHCIFEKTLFSQTYNIDLEQGKLMAALNSQKKGPKTRSSNVHNRLNFGEISKKDLLCTKT